MSHSPWRYGLAALLVAWLIDLLFWQTPPGVSLFIWAFSALAAGFALAYTDGVRPSRWSYLLALGTLVFAAFTFLRSEGLTLALSFCLTFASLMLLAATFRTGNWIAYRIWDYVVAFINLLVAVFSRPVELFRRAIPAEGGGTPAGITWRKGGKYAGRVLVGLVLALPILAIFGALLSSADPIFSNQLTAFFALFDIRRLGEYILRLTYILLLALIFSGVYLHAVKPIKEESRPDPSQTWLKPFLGWIESSVVLGLVDLMFAVFVVIQFWYFFGGQANISSSGFTYADYARRGFFELVAVAVISLGLYLGLATITRRETTFQQRSFTGMSVFLMAMVLVMLVSAFERLLLYENAYGFTQLRMYTHIFMIWLGLLLAAAIIFELIRRRQHFGLALLVCTAGFGLTFGFFNLEDTIAHQNIARARQGLELDTAYLSGLGDDGVPALVAEYRRSDQPQTVRDALGAELACRSFRLAAEQANQPAPRWPSFNFSTHTAEALLAQAQPEWSFYKVQINDSGPGIFVNGKLAPCYPNIPMD
jgi:hypothetical protein